MVYIVLEQEEPECRCTQIMKTNYELYGKLYEIIRKTNYENKKKSFSAMRPHSKAVMLVSGLSNFQKLDKSWQWASLAPTKISLIKFPFNNPLC